MHVIDPAAQPELRRALDAEVERRFGRFGGVERRGATPVSDIPTELRVEASGNPARDGQLAVKGYASVFNRWSLDLGGFREKILPGAFDRALAKDNTIFLLWDHQPLLVLGSTHAIDPESLELRVDPTGLRFFSRVVPTSWAADLRALMEAGIVKEASFAFTVAEDEWVEKNGEVLRTIIEVEDLYDVTITATPAYPQTVSSIVRALAYDFGHDSGRLHSAEANGDVAPSEGTAAATPSRESGGPDQEALEAMRARLEELKSDIKRRR